MTCIGWYFIGSLAGAGLVTVVGWLIKDHKNRWPWNEARKLEEKLILERLRVEVAEELARLRQRARLLQKEES